MGSRGSRVRVATLLKLISCSGPGCIFNPDLGGINMEAVFSKLLNQSIEIKRKPT